jgi:putative ABC transport system permease protein
VRVEHWWYTLPLRLRTLFRRGDVERELDEELQFHLEQQVADNIANGMSAADARTAALRSIGGLERRKEQCRDTRGVSLIENLVRDVHYALRALRRSPGFAFAAIVTLAFGIGASTAMFSVVNGILMRRLPFAEPDRLVRLWEVSPQGNDHNVIAPANYLDWRARARSFSEMGAFRIPYGVAMTGTGEPQEVIRLDVTPSALRLLRVSPLIGRSFTEEDAQQANRVALLSYAFWRARYSGEASVIGRTVRLNDNDYTIVGVMPAGFDFPSADVQLYRPVWNEDLDPTERGSHNWHAIARLADGVTVESAHAELRVIARALAIEHPRYMTGYSTNVVGMHEDLVREVRPLLLVLFSGVGIVLLIACANVSNLLLARAVSREGEMAVRGSLGASRARLLGQTLSESLVLSMIAATAGVLIAFTVLRVLLALAPTDIPLLERVTLDWRGLGYAVGVSVLSAVVFGLVPAVRLSRIDLHAVMRSAQRGSTARHMTFRNALFAAEVALSVMLLTGAGVVVRSFLRAQGSDLGFDATNVLSVSIDLPEARYSTSDAHRLAYEQMLDRVRAIPGVAVAGLSSDAPATGANATFSFTIEGRPSGAPSGRYDPQILYLVTPEYFSVLRVPLLRGRMFTAQDRAGSAPVTLLSESLAKLYWDGDPVGTRIRFRNQGNWVEIIGVVGDIRSEGADQPPPPMMYTPYAQKDREWLSWASLIIRPQPGVDALSLATRVRDAIWNVDPQLPIQRMTTLEEMFSETIARRRFAATLLVVFAGAALLLGTIGIYGVLSYSVLHRRKEIGIRMALGARAEQVVMGVVRDAWRVTALGIAVGLVAAVAGARLLRSLLYEVSPTDHITLIGVSLLLLVVATAAAWAPARRAARTAPLLVIRDS